MWRLEAELLVSCSPLPWERSTVKDWCSVNDSELQVNPDLCCRYLFNCGEGTQRLMQEHK